MPTPTVRFLGAAGTVTGSKHLVNTGRNQVLLDCGLFQGLKALRQRNWDPPPIAAGEFEAVVLSHAHIDNSGYLPVLVRLGFQGPIYCTPATADLMKLLLPDSAYLQPEQADYANFRGFSRHAPALPLGTVEDAHAALALVQFLAALGWTGRLAISTLITGALCIHVWSGGDMGALSLFFDHAAAVMQSAENGYAPQLREARRTFLLVQAQQHRYIAVRAKPDSFALQRGAEFQVVVDLAVEHDPYRPVSS